MLSTFLLLVACFDIIKGKKWKEKYLYGAIYSTHTLKVLRHGPHSAANYTMPAFPL